MAEVLSSLPLLMIPKQQEQLLQVQLQRPSYQVLPVHDDCDADDVVSLQGANDGYDDDGQLQQLAPAVVASVLHFSFRCPNNHSNDDDDDDDFDYYDHNDRAPCCRKLNNRAHYNHKDDEAESFADETEDETDVSAGYSSMSSCASVSTTNVRDYLDDHYDKTKPKRSPSASEDGDCDSCETEDEEEDREESEEDNLIQSDVHDMNHEVDDDVDYDSDEDEIGIQRYDFCASNSQVQSALQQQQQLQQESMARKTNVMPDFDEIHDPYSDTNETDDNFWQRLLQMILEVTGAPRGQGYEPLLNPQQNKAHRYESLPGEAEL